MRGKYVHRFKNVKASRPCLKWECPMSQDEGRKWHCRSSQVPYRGCYLLSGEYFIGRKWMRMVSDGMSFALNDSWLFSFPLELVLWSNSSSFRPLQMSFSFREVRGQGSQGMPVDGLDNVSLWFIIWNHPTRPNPFPQWRKSWSEPMNGYTTGKS